MNNLKITSFLGIKFGSNSQLAKEKILVREAVKFDDENSTNDVLFFDGVTFAGRQTSYIYLMFVNDKFAKATVVITPKLDAFAIDVYKEIKNEINSKYYITEDDFEIFEEPYFENDGYTESGIRNGKISFSCYWKFINQNGSEDDYISLRISEDMQILIQYEDGDLSTEMVNKTKEENSEDY